MTDLICQSDKFQLTVFFQLFMEFTELFILHHQDNGISGASLKIFHDLTVRGAVGIFSLFSQDLYGNHFFLHHASPFLSETYIALQGCCTFIFTVSSSGSISLNSFSI